MKQRVGFARALVVEPELSCWTTLSALDVLVADTLRRELADLWQGHKIPPGHPDGHPQHRRGGPLADRWSCFTPIPAAFESSRRSPVDQREEKDPAHIQLGTASTRS